MRNATIFLMATALISLFAQTSDAQIAWETKLRDAHAKAKAEGKLMLLHFYTDNCIHCDQLEAGAFRSASLCSTVNANFVPVKVHGGENLKLAEMFKVTRFPCDVIVTTDGKALSHSISPQQPDRYIAMLSRAKAGYVKSQTMLAANQSSAASAQAAPPSQPAPSSQPTATTAAVDSVPNAPANIAASGPTAPQMALPTGPVATGSEQPAAPAMALPSQVDIAAGNGPQQRQNQFMLPAAAEPESGEQDGSVDAALASARRDTKPVEPAAAAEKPQLAIEGFCPVSVVNDGKWIEGKPELGVVHLGKLYLFADQQAMEQFLADPVPFTPMLNEIDVVRFFEEKKVVPGKREWGLIDPVHNRMYFFADEAAMLHFEQTFDRYLDAAIKVMDQAIAEANPGV